MFHSETSYRFCWLLVESNHIVWIKQNVCCIHADSIHVSYNFGHNNLHDRTNPITEILEVGVKLAVTARMAGNVSTLPLY